MSYRTDYARVHGLGSAKDGTEHFTAQRITAIALVFLLPFFIYAFGSALGEGRAAVWATFSHPFNAAVAILTMLAAMRHLRLGVQVVIEDYVPAGRHRLRWLIINALIWRGVGVVGLLAVARIALS